MNGILTFHCLKINVVLGLNEIFLNDICQWQEGQLGHLIFLYFEICHQLVFGQHKAEYKIHACLTEWHAPFSLCDICLWDTCFLGWRVLSPLPISHHFVCGPISSGYSSTWHFLLTFPSLCYRRLTIAVDIAWQPMHHWAKFSKRSPLVTISSMVITCVFYWFKGMQAS